MNPSTRMPISLWRSGRPSATRSWIRHSSRTSSKALTLRCNRLPWRGFVDRVTCGVARDLLERHRLRRLGAEGASCICLLPLQTLPFPTRMTVASSAPRSRCAPNAREWCAVRPGCRVLSEHEGGFHASSLLPALSDLGIPLWAAG